MLSLPQRPVPGESQSVDSPVVVSSPVSGSLPPGACRGDEDKAVEQPMVFLNDCDRNDVTAAGMPVPVKRRTRFSDRSDLPFDLQNRSKARASVFTLLFVIHVLAVVVVPFSVPGKVVTAATVGPAFRSPGVGLAVGFGAGFVSLFMLTFIDSLLLATFELIITLATLLFLEFLFFTGTFSLGYQSIGLLFLGVVAVRVLYHQYSLPTQRVVFGMLNVGRKIVLAVFPLLLFFMLLDAVLLMGLISLWVLWSENTLVFLSGIWFMQIVRYLMYSVCGSYAYLWYSNRGMMSTTFKLQMELIRRCMGPSYGTMCMTSLFLDLGIFFVYFLRLLGYAFPVFTRLALALDRKCNRGGLLLQVVKGKPFFRCSAAAHDCMRTAGTLDFGLNLYIYRAVFIVSAIAGVAPGIGTGTWLAFLLAFGLSFSLLSAFDAIASGLWLAFSQSSDFASEVGGPGLIQLVDSMLRQMDIRRETSILSNDLDVESGSDEVDSFLPSKTKTTKKSA